MDAVQLNLRNFVLTLVRTHRNRVWCAITTAASEDRDLTSDFTFISCLEMAACRIVRFLALTFVLGQVSAVLEAAIWLVDFTWL